MSVFGPLFSEVQPKPSQARPLPPYDSLGRQLVHKVLTDDDRKPFGIKFELGDVYDGYVNSEQSFDGEGTLRNVENNYLYVGNFKNNEFHGHGVLTMPENVYDGEFKNGKRHGYGKLTQKFGDGVYKYIGYFKKGKRHGKGLELFPNGSGYDGDWVNDTAHGYGIFKFKDGSRYDGHQSNNTFHGKGKFVFANGDWFEGNWVHGRGGKGVGHFTLPDNTAYVGELIFEKTPDGHGTKTYPNGDTYTGQWLAGKRHGDGTTVTASGQTRHERFANDVFVKTLAHAPKRPETDAERKQREKEAAEEALKKEERDARRREEVRQQRALEHRLAQQRDEELKAERERKRLNDTEAARRVAEVTRAVEQHRPFAPDTAASPKRAAVNEEDDRLVRQSIQTLQGLLDEWKGHAKAPAGRRDTAQKALTEAKQLLKVCFHQKEKENSRFCTKPQHTQLTGLVTEVNNKLMK